MSKSTVASDVIVERNGDIDGVSNDVLEVTEGLEVVFAFDIFFVGRVHTSEETTDGSDTISLTDSKDGCIDMGGTSFQSTVSVGNSTTCVIVEVAFNIA